MKLVTLVIMSFFIIVFYLVSCKDDSSGSIVGKWNVINDSSFLAGNGVFPWGSSNYRGISTDYYDFASSGDLYIRKGNEMDTAKFSLPSNNRVTLVYYSFAGITFGSNGATRGTYNITILTQHRLTLTLSATTPEGQEYEIINLKK